jgi:hypothetical protein
MFTINDNNKILFLGTILPSYLKIYKTPLFIESQALDASSCSNVKSLHATKFILMIAYWHAESTPKKVL